MLNAHTLATLNLERAINSLKVLNDNCDFYGKKLERGWNKRGPLMASLREVDLIGFGLPFDLPKVFLRL